MTTVCCTDLILALEMPLEVSSKYLISGRPFLEDEAVEAADLRGLFRLPSTIAEEGTLLFLLLEI
jgi:hypothetical protein